MRGWVARWTPPALKAAQALGALFAIEGIASVPAGPCLERAEARQRAIAQELGLLGGGRP